VGEADHAFHLVPRTEISGAAPPRPSTFKGFPHGIYYLTDFCETRPVISVKTTNVLYKFYLSNDYKKDDCSVCYFQTLISLNWVNSIEINKEALQGLTSLLNVQFSIFCTTFKILQNNKINSIMTNVLWFVLLNILS